MAGLCVAVLVAACAGTDGQADRDRATPRATEVRPSAASKPDSIARYRVNEGTQGMRMTVRWALAPDRRALVVVEDAVSIEAEALPNGFLYASELSGAIVQIDSVWDVAPSPDWRKLAFGRAFVLRSGERDTVPPEEWQRIERQMPEDVGARDGRALRRQLERHAFAASGMSTALGLGLAQVLWVDSLPGGHAAVPRAVTHSLHGWRVRWNSAGDTIAVGAAPRAVQDDADPARWVLVAARRFADAAADSGGVVQNPGRLASVAWTTGPTIELGTPAPLRPREVAFDGGRAFVRDDTVYVESAAAGSQGPRALGPGMPLAATRAGEFVVVLAPRSGQPAYEMTVETVVYRIPR